MSSRLGGLLMVLGFGSAVWFSYTDFRFGFLMWADHAQPGSGIAVGVLGLLIAVLGGGRRRRERKAYAAMRYGGMPPGGYPGAYPGAYSGAYYRGWWRRRRFRRSDRYLPPEAFPPYGGYGSGPYGDGYGDGYDGPYDPYGR